MESVSLTAVIPTVQYPEVVIERFWAKVDKDGPIPAGRPDLGPCWLWTASTRHGYGQLNVGNKRVTEAHRISSELHNGPIPEGMDIDHVCRVPRCVNPAHLRASTHKQNLENRGPQKGSKSGVRGVSWNTSKGRWGVFVGHYGKSHFGGWFTEVDVAEVAAVKLRNELHTHNALDRMS